MHSPPTLTVSSLGAFGRTPDCAIFPDTRWEPYQDSWPAMTLAISLTCQSYPERMNNDRRTTGRVTSFDVGLPIAV